MSSFVDMRDGKEYRSFMVKFADEHTSDDLMRLKYVLKDHIPAGKLEQLHKALDIFSQLEQKALLGPNNFDFILDLIEDINKPHLLKMLKRFVDETKLRRMRRKIEEFKSITGKEVGSRCCSEQYAGIVSRRNAFSVRQN